MPSLRVLAPLVLFASFLAVPVPAQDAPSPVVLVPREPPKGLGNAPGLHFVLEGGIEMGGDMIVELIFLDGSTQEIFAGQGGTVAAGVEYRFAGVPRLALGATLGYKFVTTAADNADIKFTRIPVEVTARWSLNDAWWVGGGLVRHSSIEFDGDGFTPDVSLGSASGFTAELGWKWLALSYTAIDYDDAGSDLDAGSIGATVRWVFGARR